MRLQTTTLVLALGVLALPSHLRAQCQSLVFDTDEPNHKLFGRSISLCGNEVVVTSRDTASPTAYLHFLEWTPTGWERRDLHSLVLNGNNYGTPLSLTDGVLYCGDDEHVTAGGTVGGVHVFEKRGSGWVHAHTLLASNGDHLDEFGASLDTRGDLLLVGAPRHAGSALITGAAYLFEQVGGAWNEKQRLEFGAAGNNEYFGLNLALGPEFALVGTKRDRVVVFTETPQGFVETQVLAPSGLDPMNIFGWAIEVSGNWALISDCIGDVGGKDGAGMVYAYEWVGGQFVQRDILWASDADENDHFGWRMALAGDRALIGAPYDGGGDRGAAYLFERVGSGWVQAKKVLPTAPIVYDQFGSALVLDESGRALIGAPTNVYHGTPPGRVYEFLLDGPDCNRNGVPDPCDIESGTSQDTDGDGIPDECGCVLQTYCEATANSTGASSSITALGYPGISINDWTLQATRCPPGQFGLFYYGLQQTQVSFGDGWRCVAGQIFRLPAVQISALGDALYPLDFENPPLEAGRITAGSTWNFQFWYRDPGAGGTGFNLSKGMEMTFCP